jgi:hypothetical protein
MRQISRISIEPIVDPIWLIPTEGGRAVCITEGCRQFRWLYRPIGDGTWLVDGELTEAQMERVRRDLSEAQDWGAPIFHCPDNPQLDKPIAALSRALYERSTPVRSFHSRMVAPLLGWLVEGLAKNQEPADVCAAFRRSILELRNEPETAHEANVAMASILVLMQKIKAAIDERR